MNNYESSCFRGGACTDRVFILGKGEVSQYTEFKDAPLKKRVWMSRPGPTALKRLMAEYKGNEAYWIEGKRVF